jgi:AraC-like DNA-binding protein
MEILLYTRNKVRRFPALPPTRLEYMDVTVLFRGVMRYGINGSPVLLHAGDAIVFAPGDVRERASGGTAAYCSFNVRLTEEERAALPRVSGVIRGGAVPEIEALQTLYENTMNVSAPYVAARRQRYFEAIYLTLCDTAASSVKDPHVAAIRKYISEHMSEPITLEEIGRAVFLTPNYCNTIFRRAMGTTIMQYLLTQRMQEAKELLAHSDVPMKEIARRLGYREYNYFSSQFKKFTHLTPSQFREQWDYTDPDAGRGAGRGTHK